jgi:hypothetical protein
MVTVMPALGSNKTRTELQEGEHCTEVISMLTQTVTQSLYVWPMHGCHRKYLIKTSLFGVVVVACMLVKTARIPCHRSGPPT